jgi:hypothetical protein
MIYTGKRIKVLSLVPEVNFSFSSGFAFWSPKKKIKNEFQNEKLF